MTTAVIPTRTFTVGGAVVTTRTIGVAVLLRTVIPTRTLRVTILTLTLRTVAVGGAVVTTGTIRVAGAVIPTRTVTVGRAVIPTRAIPIRGAVIPTRTVTVRRTVVPTRPVIARTAAIATGALAVIACGAVIAARTIVPGVGTDGAGLIATCALLRGPATLGRRVRLCSLGAVAAVAGALAAGLSGRRRARATLAVLIRGLLAVARFEVLGCAAAGRLLALGHGCVLPGFSRTRTAVETRSTGPDSLGRGPFM